MKLRADRLLLVDNPSTRSFTSSRARPPLQLASQSARLEKAQCPQGRQPAPVRLIPGLADHLLPAALRTRPQPRRRHLVAAAARLALQRRLQHPRTPRPDHPPRSPPHPVPQSPHRRLPHRDRTDHQPLITEDDITSSTSVGAAREPENPTGVRAVRWPGPSPGTLRGRRSGEVVR